MTVEMVLAIIILLFLFIFIIDVVPLFKTWFLRIKIGRYHNIIQWSEAITTTGARWLNHTPKIKITDNTRLIVFDILKGNFSKTTLQHWQEASLLQGLIEYLKSTDDQEIKNSILRFLDKTFYSNGQWRDKPQFVDSAILAYAIMTIDFIEKDKYKPAFDYIWNLIQDHVGDDGTVGYRKSMNNYRYVDTIGFICPFLVSYGLEFNKQECIELAFKQLKEYNKWGMLEHHGIPCHAYDINTKAPLGLYGWGRGLGWYAIGLMGAYNELPNGHGYKNELEKMVLNFTESILEYQGNNGGWGWTVTRKEARTDSSATATLSWFLINAAKITSISKKSLKGAELGLKYLMSVTRRDGAIEFSQGDTKDIGVYSTQFNILPFTQGSTIALFILFISFKKLNKLEKNAG